MSTGSTGDAATGEGLLAEGEAALARGDSEAAFDILARAAEAGVGPTVVHRLATAFATAGRYQNRHSDVLTWIDRSIESAPHDRIIRAGLLRARVAVCRQLDIKRVLELAEEALLAADEAGHEEAFASVLAHAAFAAYRRGDPRAAQEFAERAAARAFNTPAAHYDAVRTQMFAAITLGDLEKELELAVKARALAREQERPADVANESNNLAEAYLELGYPAEALRCAEAAVEVARGAGHVSVMVFGHVLIAAARAEGGDIDRALEEFDHIGPLDDNRIFAVDFALTHAYWLLERNAAGDAQRARQIAEQAIERAEAAGVVNRLTGLYANVARALGREGQGERARDALESARLAAESAEPRAQSLLALAVAEVLPVSVPKRRVALRNARAAIMRASARREDPSAYCTRVRLHRRILELSGGVPDDLPNAS